MKRILIFALLIGILVMSVPAATVTIYPITAINATTRILPNTDTGLPGQGMTLNQSTTPGQNESSSFAIKAVGASVSDMAITNTAPTNESGGQLPVSVIDIKIVKCWYQTADGTDNMYYTAGAPPMNLTPELLLNNDTLINVSYTAKTNSIYVTNVTGEHLVPIDNRSIGLGTWVANWTVFDHKTAGGFPQPFKLASNENKQIYLITGVPAGTPAGNYTAKVWINSSLTTSTSLNFTFRVLPFALLRANASLDYGMYYLANIATPDLTDSQPWVGANWYDVNNGAGAGDAIGYKQQSNTLKDLYNLKNHGIMYPVTYQYRTNASQSTDYRNWYLEMLNERDTVGFPKDKYLAYSTMDDNEKIASSSTDLNNLGIHIAELLTDVKAHGYSDVYVTGIDEAGSAAARQTEVPALNIALKNGSKTWVSANDPYYDTHMGADGTMHDIASYVSAVNLYTYPAYSPNVSEVNYLHSLGKRVWMYGDPQGGLEKPETYRKNYGLNLYKNGYDGAVIFAYQAAFGYNYGYPWNDYSDTEDATPLRQHMMAYPTTDGYIGTIEMEGLRQGIDDVRYVDKLNSLAGSNTTALATINAGLTTTDMQTIRNNLTTQILGYYPHAEFVCSPLSGLKPLTVTCTDKSTGV